MPNDTVEVQNWLTLTQAAKQLNIHPTTLRRWADNGEIPFMLTPGGHRRFSESAISEFADNRHRLRTVAALEQIWADQALTQTRQEIVIQKNENEPWLVNFDTESRKKHRKMGRQLLGLTLQYLADPEGNTHILDEAHSIGKKYGEFASQAGLPLTEAIEAAIFFRDTLMEVALELPSTARVQSGANVRLMRRINELLNTVHLAIAETYETKHE